MSEHRTGQLDHREVLPADALLSRFLAIRAHTLELVAPLALEDYSLQGMADTSPPKWHLAHTSWFFDTFVLAPFQSRYKPHHQRFHYLFNSYYLGEGRTFSRAQRGLLSRPSLEDVRAYRQWVDDNVASLLTELSTQPSAEQHQILSRILLGIHHECQHQELILTDIKYSLFQNPLLPALTQTIAPALMPRPSDPAPAGVENRAGAVAADPRWLTFAEQVVEIGHQPSPQRFQQSSDFARFAYDNESPRHRVIRPAVAIADRLVTNGEYLAFMQDDGYQRPELWLSEGFYWAKGRGVTAPLYWLSEAELDRSFGAVGLAQEPMPPRPTDRWFRYGIAGVEPVEMSAPVAHISYYEADAFARWRGARLPTEAEWESCVGDQQVAGNLLTPGGVTEPRPYFLVQGAAEGSAEGLIGQAFGDVWEWTQSSYAPYPGFVTAEGSIGEYNGKFMVNQYVLKGGSSFTPAHHIRPSYRNFFPASSRWQSSGLRLAKDTS